MGGKLLEFSADKYYNEGKADGKEEGYDEGHEDGRKEEREERNTEVAIDLINEGGLSVPFIARISKLSEDAVRDLAKSLEKTVF